MAAPTDSQFHTLWPTVLSHRMWAEHAKWAPQIIEHLYELRDGQSTPIASGVAPQAKSEKGLYESDFDLLDSDHQGLRALRDFINAGVQQVVAKINGSQVPPARISVDIVESWFHITNDGGFHDAHYHGGCSWCGIYYLQIGDASKDSQGAPNGVNRFYSPIPTGMKAEDYGNQYLGNCYLDAPLTDGMLLLFPAFLLHSALPYRGAKDRIIISFNSRSNVGG